MAEAIPEYDYYGGEAEHPLDNEELLKDWGFTKANCARCGARNSDIEGLLIQCGYCKKAYYCSPTCWKNDLEDHKQFCKTTDNIEKAPEAQPYKRPTRSKKDVFVPPAEDRNGGDHTSSSLGASSGSLNFKGNGGAGFSGLKKNRYVETIKQKKKKKKSTEPKKRIPIWVTDPNGKTTMFIVKPDDTIASVKKAIAEDVGINAHLQSLFYNNGELDDTWTLEEYGIGKGAKLEVKIDTRPPAEEEDSAAFSVSPKSAASGKAPRAAASTVNQVPLSLEAEEVEEDVVSLTLKEEDDDSGKISLTLKEEQDQLHGDDDDFDSEEEIRMGGYYGTSGSNLIQSMPVVGRPQDGASLEDDLNASMSRLRPPGEGYLPGPEGTDPETVHLREAETLKREIVWYKPDWALKKTLRNTEKGEKLKQMGDLREAERLERIRQDDRPEWVKQRDRLLKKTQVSDTLQKGGNLATPISPQRKAKGSVRKEAV